MSSAPRGATAACAVVVGLGHLDRVGLVDDLAGDELEEVPHDEDFAAAFAAALSAWNFSQMRPSS